MCQLGDVHDSTPPTPAASSCVSLVTSMIVHHPPLLPLYVWAWRLSHCLHGYISDFFPPTLRSHNIFYTDNSSTHATSINIFKYNLVILSCLHPFLHSCPSFLRYPRPLPRIPFPFKTLSSLLNITVHFPFLSELFILFTSETFWPNIFPFP